MLEIGLPIIVLLWMIANNLRIICAILLIESATKHPELREDKNDKILEKMLGPCILPVFRY